MLLWWPSGLQARGYSSAVASGILAKSSLLALPTILLAACFYDRRSSKWTLVGRVALTVIGLVGALLPPAVLSWEPLLVAVIAVLIVRTNGTIAVLLPYTAENYPLGTRGRPTGLVAGSSKFGGVAVQVAELTGFAPTLVSAALTLLILTVLSAGLIAWSAAKRKDAVCANWKPEPPFGRSPILAHQRGHVATGEAAQRLSAAAAVVLVAALPASGKFEASRERPPKATLNPATGAANRQISPASAGPPRW